MAPKSDASHKAFQLHKSGLSRAEALERLSKDFPDVSKARRSQLLQQYWGTESVTASGNEETAAKTIVKSAISVTGMSHVPVPPDDAIPSNRPNTFTAKLFQSNISRDDATQRLRAKYPDMDKGQRSRCSEDSGVLQLAPLALK